MTKVQFNPLRSGKLCPSGSNSNDWETMKKNWSCTDPGFYHCIPDQYNIPGQICVKPNWASKNYCPIFNTAANDIDLIPCDLQYGACPDTDYRSNEVYLYPGCLNKSSIIEITSQLPEGTQIKSDSILEIIIPVVSGIVLLMLCTVICLLWRRRSNGSSTSQKDKEMPLLDKRDIPIDFQRLIRYHEEGMFVATGAYKEAVGKLDTYGWVTLVGPPGSGKSMTAIKLAMRKLGQKLPSKKNTTFHFCKCLNDVHSLEIDSVEPYVILDDFLEQYRYYPSKLSEDKAEFEKVFDKFIKPGLVHIIFTVQRQTWVNLLKMDLHPQLADTKSVVNLEGKLTIKEKECMLRKHLGIRHINIADGEKGENLNPSSTTIICENTVQKIASKLKADPSFSEPVIIDFMCANRYFLKNHSHIVSKPFTSAMKKHVEKWMKFINEEDKQSFCVVLFAALCGGRVSVDDFFSHAKGHIYTNICKKFGLQQNMKESREEIETMMKENVHVYGFLYQVENSDLYMFYHDSLLHSFLVFACEDEKFFIGNVNFDYLINRCRLSPPLAEKIKNKAKEIIDPSAENVFELTEYELLVDRIKEEKNKHRYLLPDWENHIFMTNATFKARWNKKMSSPEYGSSETRKCDIIEDNDGKQKLKKYSTNLPKTEGCKAISEFL